MQSIAYSLQPQCGALLEMQTTHNHLGIANLLDTSQPRVFERNGLLVLPMGVSFTSISIRYLFHSTHYASACAYFHHCFLINAHDKPRIFSANPNQTACALCAVSLNLFRLLDNSELFFMYVYAVELVLCHNYITQEKNCHISICEQLCL